MSAAKEELLLKNIDLHKFSERLKETVEEAGLSYLQAVDLAVKTGNISGRVALSHLRGDRKPRRSNVEAFAEIYARAFRVDRDWLLYGRFHNEINQLDGSPNEDTSHLTPFRRIAITAPRKTANRNGSAGMRAMNHMPFPDAIAIDDAAFIWCVPEGDLAMVGNEYKLIPGTYLVVVPATARDINPGHIVLCRPKGYTENVVRMVKASGPISVVKRYELVSPNPLFDPIAITSPADCRVVGRVLFSINQL